jgi:predicted DNA-binding transcriptional regulator AlpA
MSILTQAMIFEKYGPRLGIPQLAELTSMKPKTIYNQVSAGTFPIKTYVDGGQRWADYRDAAAHFDSLRAQAA